MKKFEYIDYLEKSLEHNKKWVKKREAELIRDDDELQEAENAVAHTQYELDKIKNKYQNEFRKMVQKWCIMLEWPGKWSKEFVEKFELESKDTKAKK